MSDSSASDNELSDDGTNNDESNSQKDKIEDKHETSSNCSSSNRDDSELLEEDDENNERSSTTGDENVDNKINGEIKTDEPVNDGKNNKALDFKTADSKVVSSKIVDSKTDDSKAVDSKVADSKIADSKAADSKAGDSKTDSKSVDSKAEIVKKIKTEGVLKSEITIQQDIKFPPLDEQVPNNSSNNSSSSDTAESGTIVVRSANQVNKILSDSETTVIDDDEEDEENDGSSSASGLSVLNPEQLGATPNNSSGNMMESVDYNNQPFENQSEFVPLDTLENGLLCDVCENRFPDGLVLEQHKTSAGHFKCHYSPECTTLFATNVQLVNHQTTVHGIQQQSLAPPIAQLTQQVRGLPVPYQTQPHISQNFSVPQVQQPRIMSVSSQQISHPVNYQSNQNFLRMPQDNNMPPQQFTQLPPQQPRMMRVGDIGTRNNYTPRLPSKRASPLPPRNVTPVKRRLDDPMRRTNSSGELITSLSKTITIMSHRDTTPKKSNETNAVASILANRGITVTATRSNQNAPTLNLNSAVSIIPTNSPNKQASPGRSRDCTTVDLTGPDVPNRGRVGNRSNEFMCQVCDKVFPSQITLDNHMDTHRSGRRPLPYKCNQCTAQYQTQVSLAQHKNTVHRDGSNNFVAGTNDMAIPVVDLNQRDVMARLRSAGIHHLIPFSNLGTQHANGSFAIPIIALGDRHSVNSIGASFSMSLGPLRSVR